MGDARAFRASASQGVDHELQRLRYLHEKYRNRHAWALSDLEWAARMLYELGHPSYAEELERRTSAYGLTDDRRDPEAPAAEAAAELRDTEEEPFSLAPPPSFP